MTELDTAPVYITVGPVTVSLMGDDRICQHIIGGKTFEPDSLKKWSEMVVPGTDVIDVGAYSGLFSISAAKLGARPIPIEPMPVMVTRIEDNARMNGVWFKIIKAAASDSGGMKRLGYNEKVHLTSGASLNRKSGGAEMVKGIMLDDLDLSRVSAVKIDVEGLEMAVLAGAMKMLLRHRPKLLIEVLSGEARKAVEAKLTGWRTKLFLDNRNLYMEPR